MRKLTKLTINSLLLILLLSILVLPISTMGILGFQNRNNSQEVLPASTVQVEEKPAYHAPVGRPIPPSYPYDKELNQPLQEETPESTETPSEITNL